MKVTVWNENYKESVKPELLQLYPGGLHGYITAFLERDGIPCRTATMDMPEHGLTEEVLQDTDVLIWWGHAKHKDVSDEVAQRVQQRVLGGMGLIVLHSGHHSKIFKTLMGTSCNLKWRDGARERLWVIDPAHPIVRGVDETFALDPEEMYGEPFDVPAPDETVLLGWFNGGEVFRAGCTWRRGSGRVFYFQPGHETNASFQNKNVQKIIANAVRWAAPTAKAGIPVQKWEALEQL